MKYIIYDNKYHYDVLVEKGKGAVYDLLLQEIEDIFSEQTGEKILIGTEWLKKSKKYIVFGETELSKSEGITSDGVTTADGFSIQTKNGHIFISANGHYGLLYGLYRLMNLMGVYFYAEDEITTPENRVWSVEDCHIIDNPDIQDRVRELSYAHAPKNYETRLNYNIGKGRSWITWAHTHFSILPKEEYYLQHKDWYSPNGMQLCLTNLEMREEFVRRVKKKISAYDLEKASTHYLMLGHEDNNFFCDCERCKASNAKYGGASGTMMRFVNAVADEVNAFTKANYPDKTIKTLTFGYGPTTVPPIVETETGYIPIDESVIAHENVGVMIAPLGSDWYHSLTDEKYNPTTALALNGWSAIKPELFIWTYSSVFDDCFIPIDDYTRAEESFRTFKALNTSYVFDQGTGTCEKYISFEVMNNFIKGKLMWNVNSDVFGLIDEFMTAYYKEAREEVRAYFYAILGNYKRLNEEYEKAGKVFALRSYVRTNPDYRTEEYWSKDFLLSCLRLLNTGIEKAEKIADEKERKRVCNRVQAQRITPVYLLLELYFNDFDKTFIENLVNILETDCAVNGIVYYKEWGEQLTATVVNKLHEYRSQFIN